MFKLVPVKSMTPYKVTGSVHDVLCVGRAPQSDLCVTDRLISANHARLSLKGLTLQVMDLDSRNGTEVNGRRLKPFTPHTLQASDVIDFAGRLALRVEISQGAVLPVLQVEAGEPAHATVSSGGGGGGGILRVMRPSSDAAPALKAERWAQLCALGVRLSSRALQARALTWSQTLCEEGAALLGISQLQLLRLVDGRPVRVFPHQGACRVRGEALDALLSAVADHPYPNDTLDTRACGVAIGVEVLCGELDALDLQETFDAPSTIGAPVGPQIVTLYLGALWVGQRLWGGLYATHELSGRRRPLDEHDAWAMERLCALVGPALEGVMVEQALLWARGEGAARGGAETLAALLGAAAEGHPGGVAALSEGVSPLLLPASLMPASLTP
jgi:hypothetical protein